MMHFPVRDIYATARRSAAIDITLKYVTRLNDVNVNDDGSFAQKKKKLVTPLDIKVSSIYAKILSKQYFAALALHIRILT